MLRVIPGLRRLFDGGGDQAGTEQKTRAEPAPPRPPAAEDVPLSPVMSRGRRRRGTVAAEEVRDLAAEPAVTQPQLDDTGGPAPDDFDIYNEHFGLTARPFALVPDPDFLFWAPFHKRAYAMLEYGIMTRAPITLITGEVGAGKTLLLHNLLRSLPQGTRVGLISNPSGSRDELLRWVLMSLGQPTSAGETYVDLFSRFQAYLIEEYSEGRRVVLIIDEAQNLGREALEELRMFTNINSGKDELLQLVLVGQPELRAIIRQPSMRQFAQRVASSFHLPEMDLRTVRAYVSHRMKVAGSSGGVFTAPAVELIHSASGGVPRVINQLCDLALLYAYTSEHKTVNRSVVQHVLDDGALFAVNAADSKSDS